VTKREREVLRAELRQVTDVIDAAYWTFTRTARGKPPILVVPEAYRRRAEIEAALRGKGPDLRPGRA
jgi:hypothetical protein